MSPRPGPRPLRETRAPDPLLTLEQARRAEAARLAGDVIAGLVNDPTAGDVIALADWIVRDGVSESRSLDLTSVDLERLKVGTSGIPNELLAEVIDAPLDRPVHEPDRELEVRAQPQNVRETLVHLGEGFIEGSAAGRSQVRVPRVAHSERDRGVVVGVCDVHGDSSSVGGSGAGTPDAGTATVEATADASVQGDSRGRVSSDPRSATDTGVRIW